MPQGNRSVSNGINCAPPEGIELAVSLSTQVRLEQGRLTFSGHLKNASEATITTLSWPVLGDLGAAR